MSFSHDRQIWSDMGISNYRALQIGCYSTRCTVPVQFIQLTPIHTGGLAVWSDLEECLVDWLTVQYEQGAVRV